MVDRSILDTPAFKLIENNVGMKLEKVPIIFAIFAGKLNTG